MRLAIRLKGILAEVPASGFGSDGPGSVADGFRGGTVTITSSRRVRVSGIVLLQG